MEAGLAAVDEDFDGSWRFDGARRVCIGRKEPVPDKKKKDAKIQIDGITN